MLSAKSQYAVLAMLQMAQEYPSGELVQAPRIAERHRIPANFLVQILHELKRSGLAVSTRGACGGYRLGSDPGAITLADVVDVFEGSPPVCCAAEESPFASATIDLCWKLTRARRAVLQSMTLGELLERAAVAADGAWQI